MMYLLRFGWVDKDQTAWPACLAPMQLCVRRFFFPRYPSSFICHRISNYRYPRIDWEELCLKAREEY